MVDVDPDRHRCLPIVGKGQQCHTGAAIPVKGADDSNAKGGDERSNQFIGRTGTPSTMIGSADMGREMPLGTPAKITAPTQRPSVNVNTVARGGVRLREVSSLGPVETRFEA